MKRIQIEVTEQSAENIEMLKMRLGINLGQLISLSLAFLEMSMDRDPEVEKELRNHLAQPEKV